MCGFDAGRWSEDDLERTLVHADDLLGFVLDGADDRVGSVISSGEADLDAPGHRHGHAQDGADDRADRTHRVMHRLHEVAAIRRELETFEPMLGRVESLQASGGGVPKLPIERAEIDVDGVVGDVQGNRRNHGRPWQAVCVYSAGLLAALRSEGHPIVAGGAGENMTVSGLDWSRLRGGLTIEIGDVRLVTSSPAAPCHKIAENFRDRDWMRIDHGERPGWARWYASVLTGGSVAPGDEVRVTA